MRPLSRLFTGKARLLTLSTTLASLLIGCSQQQENQVVLFKGQTGEHQQYRTQAMDQRTHKHLDALLSYHVKQRNHPTTLQIYVNDVTGNAAAPWRPLRGHPLTMQVDLRNGKIQGINGDQTASSVLQQLSQQAQGQPVSAKQLLVPPFLPNPIYGHNRASIHSSQAGKSPVAATVILSTSNRLIMHLGTPQPEDKEQQAQNQPAEPDNFIGMMVVDRKTGWLQQLTWFNRDEQGEITQVVMNKPTTEYRQSPFIAAQQLTEQPEQTYQPTSAQVTQEQATTLTNQGRVYTNAAGQVIMDYPLPTAAAQQWPIHIKNVELHHQQQIQTLAVVPEQVATSQPVLRYRVTGLKQPLTAADTITATVEVSGQQSEPKMLDVDPKAVSTLNTDGQAALLFPTDDPQQFMLRLYSQAGNRLTLADAPQLAGAKVTEKLLPDYQQPWLNDQQRQLLQQTEGLRSWLIKFPEGKSLPEQLTLQHETVSAQPLTSLPVTFHQ